MTGNFALSESCFLKSQDYNSLLLFYSSYGDLEGLKSLVEAADKNGKYNVALEAAFMIGDADKCIEILMKSKRIAEAAFFARAYAPSKINLVMKQWEDALKQRELPFQPENILKLDSLSETMQEALVIETDFTKRFYSKPKPSAEEFEELKKEYYYELYAAEAD